MSDKEQLNEVAPLVAALIGALVGMGLEKNKAKRAAAKAVDDAKTGNWKNPDAPGGAPAARTTGVVVNGKITRSGPQVKRLQQLLYGKTTGPEIDGKFGPNTEKRLRTFQKNQGLKVDGIAGKNTIAKLNRMQADSSDTLGNIPKAKTKTAKIMKSNEPVMAGYGEGTDMSDDNQINEEITISGSADDLIRMMQLAGASGAKQVDVDDITPHSQSGPAPSMGDMIHMMSTEQDEEDYDGHFPDASTEPDEKYMNDVSASIPAGNDMHKSKKSYKATSGGDNPMNTEASIKQKLYKALAEKDTHKTKDGRTARKGLYYYVNKAKKAGTSRDKDHPDAPSKQDWKDAAKTAKK